MVRELKLKKSIAALLGFMVILFSGNQLFANGSEIKDNTRLEVMCGNQLYIYTFFMYDPLHNLYHVCLCKGKQTLLNYEYLGIMYPKVEIIDGVTYVSLYDEHEKEYFDYPVSLKITNPKFIN